MISLTKIYRKHATQNKPYSGARMVNSHINALNITTALNSVPGNPGTSCQSAVVWIPLPSCCCHCHCCCCCKTPFLEELDLSLHLCAFRGPRDLFLVAFRSRDDTPSSNLRSHSASFTHWPCNNGLLCPGGFCINEKFKTSFTFSVCRPLRLSVSRS